MAPVPTLIAILRRRTSKMGHKAVDSNMWQTKFPPEFFSPSKISSGCYICKILFVSLDFVHFRTDVEALVCNSDAAWDDMMV